MTTCNLQPTILIQKILTYSFAKYYNFLTSYSLFRKLPSSTANLLTVEADRISVTFNTSETKLDFSFPLNQFHIDGFTTPYRLDRNQNGRGIMLYIRQRIPSKSLTEIKLDNEIENIFIEINLGSKKWLIIAHTTQN